MIRTHGENAEKVAAQHLDERLAEGDMLGRDIWRQIVMGIGKLRRVTRRE